MYTNPANKYAKRRRAEWAVQRMALNHPEIAFRVDGSYAQAARYNALSDARRAARRAARYARNHDALPPRHIAEKLPLLAPVKQ